MHTYDFMRAFLMAASELDRTVVEDLAIALCSLRKRGGRLFVLGVGGSAANASHAVNDFRKLCNIEAYCPTDNVAELTAWVNDTSWQRFYMAWLIGSNLRPEDALLCLSVGGGDILNQVSVGLVLAADYAKECGAKVFSIVGRSKADLLDIGRSDIGILVPQPEPKWVTPINEAMQMVILHCLVSHPLLQVEKTKW